MTPYDEIRLMGATLPIDGSVNGMACPFCCRDDDRQLSLKRVPDGILFCCFRATCDARGKVHDTSSHKWDMDIMEQARREPMDYKGPLEVLRFEDLIYFWEKFGISEYYTSKYILRGYPNTYVFPTYSISGHPTGYVLRRVLWGKPANGPKTINYLDPEYPKGAWYKGHVNGLVIVEDCLSAIKIVQDTGLSACALLGTHLSESGLAEIGDLQPKQVYIALDPGAENSSIRIAKDIQPYIHNINVLWLTKDIKDTAIEELQRRFT